MNHPTKTIIAAACLMLANQTATASVFGDLYQVRTEVSARDASTLEQAFEDAMAVVLTRVTGTRQDDQTEEIEAILARARDYIQQFGYIDSRTLLISFDGQAINRRLGELGLPVWGQERPATLIWLVLTDERGRREILAAEDLGPRFTGRRHTLAVHGYAGVQDAAASETTFQALVESVVAALGADRKLGATARHSGPAQVRAVDFRILSNVLCHLAEIALAVEDKPA